MIELFEVCIYQLQVLIGLFLQKIEKYVRCLQKDTIDTSFKLNQINTANTIKNLALEKDLVTIDDCPLVGEESFSLLGGFLRNLYQLWEDQLVYESKPAPYQNLLIEVVIALLFLGVAKRLFNGTKRWKHMSIKLDDNIDLYENDSSIFICDSLSLNTNVSKRPIVVEPNLIGRIPSQCSNLLQASAHDYFQEYQKLDATYCSSTTTDTKNLVNDGIFYSPVIDSLTCDLSSPTDQRSGNIVNLNLSLLHDAQTSQIITGKVSNLTALSAIESKMSVEGMISKSSLQIFDELRLQKGELRKLNQSTTKMHFNEDETKHLPVMLQKGEIDLNFNFMTIYDNSCQMNHRIEAIIKMRFIISNNYDGEDERLKNHLKSQICLFECEMGSVFKLIIDNVSEPTFALELITLITDYLRFSNLLNAKTYYEFMRVFCILNRLSIDEQVKILISKCGQDIIESLDSESFLVFLNFIDSLVIDETSSEDIDIVLDCFINCLNCNIPISCYNNDSTTNSPCLKLISSFHLLVSRISQEIDKKSNTSVTSIANNSDNNKTSSTILNQKLIEIFTKIKISIIDNANIDKAYRLFLIENYFKATHLLLLQITTSDSKLINTLVG
jgi:hypothetical protein